MAEAIESVLSQTFIDWELVISDNGSSDQTESICENYSFCDKRIKYFRYEENRGAAWNFNNVVSLASGEYFRWLAHDDRLAPTLIERSVDILNAYPDVVLCFSRFFDINSNGDILDVRQSAKNFHSLDPCQRFRSLSRLHVSQTCEEVFGLTRLSILSRTAMIGDYPDSDRTLLAELGLIGPFYEIEEPLFLHRQHEERSTHKNRGHRQRAIWFNTANKDKVTFRFWRQLFELIHVVKRSPLQGRSRLCCFTWLLNWVWLERWRLARELYMGTKEYWTDPKKVDSKLR